MGIFNAYLKPGKGVQKKDVSEKFGIKRFFVTFGDKFWKIVVLNLLFFLVNCPLFALFARLAGVGGVPYQAPVNVLFQPLAGVLRHGNSPALSALSSVFGIQVEHGYPTAVSHILTFVGLLSIFTFGLSSAAMSYVQRNFVRRQPVDVAEDFFLCIKRNFKQSLLIGIIDLAVIFVIAFDLVSYFYSNQSFGMLLLMYLTGFLSILYFLMRPYLYLMCVTFDLKIAKIFKNACILAVSGIWRGLLCGALALLVLVLNVVVFGLMPSLGVGMLFIFTVSIAWFFQIYGAWPVIKKHMIDPYYEEENKEADEPQTETVFEDRG